MKALNLTYKIYYNNNVKKLNYSKNSFQFKSLAALKWIIFCQIFAPLSCFILNIFWFLLVFARFKVAANFSYLS